MHLEVVAYPFIFLGLYFEVFMLLTFISTPAKARRNRPATTDYTPSVAIIVPCWNEETTIDATVKSLLALDYPKEQLHLFLVNDGSTDNTKEVMDSYIGNSQITVIHKENGGKHTAINVGIEKAGDYEFIGCLDADSFVAPDALREMLSAFDDPRVAASTPAMSVYNPRNLLERMQNAEYIFGIAARHVLSAVNGIYVTPGPFSVYRNSVLKEVGGFRHAHQAEDMEMALRLQRAGYEIENSPRARVFSKVPRTVPKLIKQRTRWTSGFLRNVLTDYRDLVGNPKYGVLGLLVLPLGFVAVVGGVALFGLAIAQLANSLLHTYSVVAGVPLLYIFTPRFSLEWFYAPVTFITIISIVTLAISTSFILIGRAVSKTHVDLTMSIFGYALLYGFIAPFWLMRSIADVASGHRRSWR
jgi:cellulose synthase/poly-beta-1,6-N-acetylglucosamine synthase-like glycosyltransferase